MKRRPDESYEDYRIRRREANRATKKKMRGQLIWHGKLGGPLCYPWNVSEKTDALCRENAGLLYEQLQKRGVL